MRIFACATACETAEEVPVKACCGGVEIRRFVVFGGLRTALWKASKISHVNGSRMGFGCCHFCRNLMVSARMGISVKLLPLGMRTGRVRCMLACMKAIAALR